LETELSNTNTAKSYAESRLLTLQREYNAVVKRNAEIVEVCWRGRVIILSDTLYYKKNR